jgi:hypothetical protein
MLSDLGGASSIAMVRMGDALGLYRALHAANGSPTTPPRTTSSTIPPPGNSPSPPSRRWSSRTRKARSACSAPST